MHSSLEAVVLNANGRLARITGVEGKPQDKASRDRVAAVVAPPAGDSWPYIELCARLLYRLIVMPSLRMTIQTFALLSAMVSDPDKEWYGLELSKRSNLKPGTIYPILNRLLKAGWLERRWEDIDPAIEGRPKRRLYQLTGVGAPAARLALDEHLASLSNSQPDGSFRLRSRPGFA
jgi:PadR family transcriptional regulator, regulatory protein PadR